MVNSNDRLICIVRYICDQFITATYDKYTLFIPYKKVHLTQPYRLLNNSYIVVIPTHRIPVNDNHSDILYGELDDILADDDIVEMHSKDIDMWNIVDQTIRDDMLTFLYWLQM